MLSFLPLIIIRHVDICAIIDDITRAIFHFADAIHDAFFDASP